MSGQTPTRTATASAPQVTLGSTGFAGDSYAQQVAKFGGDQQMVPPDNGTGANSQFVVEFLNSSGWVYLRSNGAAGPVAWADLNTFFLTPAQLTCTSSTDPCYQLTDPRVVWDPSSSRWFASGLGLSLNSFLSTEYVAVSQTSDPLGSWWVYPIWANTNGKSGDPCNPHGCTGDQPRLGVTADKVADFWDDYDASNGNYYEEEGRVLSKGTLMSGGSLSGSTSVDITNVNWFGVVPAADSAGGDVWAVFNATNWGDGRIHAVHIAGAVPNIGLADYSFPVSGPTSGFAPLNASQPGGSSLDGSDDRIQNTVLGGSRLVSTADTSCVTGICVRVFDINLANGGQSDTNVGVSGEDLYYGAPAFDGAGNLIMTLNQSDSTSTYPSLYATTAPSANPTSFGAPAVIKAGEATYADPADTTGTDCGTQPCRWGDYSSAQVDPCDNTFVWTSGEYATAASASQPNWGTWITPINAAFSGAAPAACAAAPTVTSVAPSSGPADCGVMIDGTNFGSARYVFFGTDSVSFRVVDSTHIFAMPDSTGSGTVDVSVVSPGGDSALNAPADQFTYTTPASPLPCVNSLSPDTSPADGTAAETVTINGAHFLYPATVTFTGFAPINVNSGTATSMTVTAPATATAQAVDVTVGDTNGTSPTTAGDVFTYTDGGYTMDAYGLVHPYGNAAPPPARTDGPNWTGWKIARGLAVRPDRGSGYVLDGWGGIHGFGGQADIANNTHAYWQGWDIARGIALDPCDSTGTSGYVLDGFGGIHTFGAHAQNVTQNFSWPGWDIARAIVVNPNCQGGYVMDGWGGLHPFGLGANAAPTTPTGFAYWYGWNIARGIVLTGNGTGYTLDGWGGIHGFGGQADIANNTHAYWYGWDIARGIATVPGVTGGYTLDGWGGVHEFGGAHSVTYAGYSAGNDIFRSID